MRGAAVLAALGVVGVGALLLTPRTASPRPIPEPPEPGRAPNGAPRGTVPPDAVPSGAPTPGASRSGAPTPGTPNGAPTLQEAYFLLSQEARRSPSTVDVPSLERLLLELDRAGMFLQAAALRTDIQNARAAQAGSTPGSIPTIPTSTAPPRPTGFETLPTDVVLLRGEALVRTAGAFPRDVDLAEMDRIVVELRRRGDAASLAAADRVRAASNEALSRRPQRFQIDLGVCDPYQRTTPMTPEQIRARVTALVADVQTLPTDLERLADVLDGCGGFRPEIERLRLRSAELRGMPILGSTTNV